MSITYVPEERDIAQYNKFKLNFDRLPNMTFFCKNVNLPGIINNAVRMETPFSAFLVPGDKTEFNTLEVSFLVDANYTAWIEVFNWITALTFPKDFEQYQNIQNTKRTVLIAEGRQRGNQYSDALLTIYSNRNNPKLRVKFKDCFPIAIGAIEFDVEKTAEEPIMCSASFGYSLYEIEKV
jgi:hypothetical protein